MFSVLRAISVSSRSLGHSSAPVPVSRRAISSSSSTWISSSSQRWNESSTPTAPQLSEGEQALKTKLEKELKGAKVDVQDVSGGCGSFYAISIAHESFKGLNTMKQHRIVNGLLAEEIKGMHGLQLKTSAE